MSSDYYVVDDDNKTYISLGQRYANGNTWFGLSRNDERGRRLVADFITENINYGKSLRIVLIDDIPPEYSKYEWQNRYCLEYREGEDDFWKKELSTNNIIEVTKEYFEYFNNVEIGIPIEYRVYDEMSNSVISHEQLLIYKKSI